MSLRPSSAPFDRSADAQDPDQREIPHQLEIFVTAWSDCTREDLEHYAIAVRSMTDTAEGEIAWWRATTDIASALRRRRLTRAACRAAHRVQQAVTDAAVRTHMHDDDRDGATRLARAAGDAARALVTGRIGDGVVDSLLLPFAGLMPLETPESVVSSPASSSGWSAIGWGFSGWPLGAQATA